LLNDKDILIEVISKIVNERIEKAFNSFTAFFKRKYNQHKIKTGKAFEEYIKLSIEKYKYTKTILYKYEPVLIEDFYVDLDLELNNKIIKTQRVENLVEINNNLIITGVAGSGKSTLMKYLFLDSIKNEAGIPIFIEIRNIKKDIFNDLFEILKEYNFPQDIDLFKKILKSGKFIVFLDGIDEVSPDIRDKISNEIIYMRDSFSNNIYIVTSRPNEKYVSWVNFAELKILPLNKEKAQLLIRKLDYENSIKDKFLNNFDIIFKNHQSFATNPLLLTLMLMTYAEYSVIPTKVSLLYEQIFEMLYSRHDATKFGYTRKHYSNLSQYEFKKIISFFSLESYLDEKIRFTKEEINGYLRRAKEILEIEFDQDQYLKDLIESVCLLIHEGFYYTFTHRTFQEYHTSFFIMNAESNLRKKLLEIAFKRVSYDRTLDLAFEMNRDIFENEFLIPKLYKIKEDTKYEKLNNNEESFKIFVENSGFNYSIITYPQTLTHFHNPYKQRGLLELVNRIYPKIYKKSNDITKYFTYYHEKYLISNVNYYRNYLKEREKRGIVLYNNDIIKKEQLLLTRDLKAKNLDDFLIFSITELKKDIKLYNFYLANIDCAYSEYLYLMFLLKKIVNRQQSRKKINILNLLISKKNSKK
jgi:hypothetical protein